MVSSSTLPALERRTSGQSYDFSCVLRNPPYETVEITPTTLEELVVHTPTAIDVVGEVLGVPVVIRHAPVREDQGDSTTVPEWQFVTVFKKECTIFGSHGAIILACKIEQRMSLDVRLVGWNEREELVGSTTNLKNYTRLIGWH